MSGRGKQAPCNKSVIAVIKSSSLIVLNKRGRQCGGRLYLIHIYTALSTDVSVAILALIVFADSPRRPGVV